MKRFSAPTEVPDSARLYRPSRRRWITVASLTAALPFEAAIAGLLPLSVRYLVDRVAGSGDSDSLYLGLTFLGSGVIAALLAGLIRDLLLPRYLAGRLAALRQRMFERVQRLALPVSRQKTPDAVGERAAAVIERFASDTALVEASATMVLPAFFLPVLQALLCTVLILWLDWHSGLLALVLWPWVLLAPSVAAARAERNRRVVAGEEKNLLGVVKESVAAQMFVRAFSLEQLRVAGFRNRNVTLARDSARLGVLPAVLERLATGGILVILAGILALSGRFAATENSGLGAGSFAAIQLLALAICNCLITVNGFLPVYVAGKAAQERIDETLDDSTDVVDSSAARLLPPLQSEIGFSNVRFTYSPAAEPVSWEIAGITARVPRGTYVAFVGPSGCGKSTLLKLLLRFYDPGEGMLTIDGHDLRSVTLASLRARMGVVFQENPVFSATIRENIKLARPDATEEAVEEAARAAGIDVLVKDLPLGYDTLVGDDGARFSTAGIQRIAIARAMLRVPDILVLDEATSALDPPDEIVIGELLKSLRRKRTVIAFTHRLSTVADADHIFVMDNGRITEQGDHFGLLAANGLYASYWNKQAGFTFSPDGRHVDVNAERLKTFPILEKIDEATLGKLAPFFVTETFPAGREIVRQNDSGDKFYIIARGRVEVWRTEESTGQSSAVAHLEDGDFFGEITLISGFPRTATVRSVTVCTCVSLERGHFNRLLEHNPELMRELSEIAVQRLRETAKATAPAGEHVSEDAPSPLTLPEAPTEATEA